MSYKMKKKVAEEKDGEYESVFDLYFKRIGKPIPILPADHHFPVDSLPSQPLSLSLPHRLLFLAHASSGFCVARTKDVMDAAEAADGGRSVRDVCLADVAVASGVRILSVSHDGSTLAAASFSHVVHFFSVTSLLDKDETPSFSCSVDPSSTIKSLEWRKMSSHLSFLLLSHQGKLHHGVVGAPLQDVSDNVDAVEWSPQGNYVALAKEDNISILSSDFSEKFSISLTLKAWIGDSNHSCIVKVDSIRWVRQDSLIVGCFLLTDDDEEESYLLQVVRSKNGKIIDVDSELVVVSFHDLYSGIVDDIMPSESGPYLLMAYLKQRLQLRLIERTLMGILYTLVGRRSTTAEKLQVWKLKAILGFLGLSFKEMAMITWSLVSALMRFPFMGKLKSKLVMKNLKNSHLLAFFCVLLLKGSS